MTHLMALPSQGLGGGGWVAKGCGKARPEVLSGEREAGSGEKYPVCYSRKPGRRGREELAGDASSSSVHLASCHALATDGRLAPASSAESSALSGGVTTDDTDK